MASSIKEVTLLLIVNQARVKGQGEGLQLEQHTAYEIYRSCRVPGERHTEASCLRIYIYIYIYIIK